MNFRLPVLFAIASVVCFLSMGYLAWLRYRPLPVTHTAVLSDDSYISDTPLLSIPDLNILLPIDDALSTPGHWPVSSVGLIHLSQTPFPGLPGNSVIYGHNWPNLLGNLHRARVGQIIYVYSSAPPKKFVISRVSEVSPDQTDLLLSSADPLLTVYTCTGFLDARRLVVTASLI